MRLKAGDSSFLAVRAGLQNVLQIFVTNAANVFLLEVSPEYPILLEEQVQSFIFLVNFLDFSKKLRKQLDTILFPG
jgi:hypothetical protein